LLTPGSIKYANKAQQAFSSSSAPSLHNALPVLERMHAAWEKISNKPQYSSFIPAPEAGTQKLDQYYQHSAESDAHIMAMGMFFFLIPYSTDKSITVQSSTPKRRWATL
jgi:hypothetical protein